MLQRGELIGDRYVVESVVAQGGMGCVYKVRDNRLDGKIWAVKETLRVGDEGDFLEEAKLLADVSHPNIPKIMDYYAPNAEGKCYLVMEHVNGETLQQRFEAEGCKLPLEQILGYMEQVCRVLAYLHRRPQPIIFRDLKPSNVMIDEFDRVQLIDFGIARHYDRYKQADTVQMGTVAFAAPEQFGNRQTDARTDMYAAGAMLYYLLTGGQFAIPGGGDLDTHADVPPALAALVRRMLDPQPGLRIQDMEQAAEQLAQLRGAATGASASAAAHSRLDAALGPTPPTVTGTRLREEQTAAGTAGNNNGLMQTVMIQRASPVGRPDEPSGLYAAKATVSQPALVIYLLDTSGSMALMSGHKRRVDMASDALHAALRQMVFRSTKGSRISARYRVAVITYSDEVTDLFGGVRSIDDVMVTGSMPALSLHRFTDTAKAFLYAEKLLKAELPRLQDCPAPLVCHMTDGVYTGEDPEPIAQRIMSMTVKDGPVLVENIFLSDDVLERHIEQPKRWAGIRPDTPLLDEYGRKLRRMSSAMPESYREMMRDAGYSLASGAVLMFPGTHPELVSLGFQMSAATPVY